MFTQNKILGRLANIDVTMMEYMLKSVLLCSFITYSGCLENITDTSDTTDGLNCSVRELVTCGNSMGYYSWEFCRPRTRDTRNILSVHLDLRYPNRYCRSYGTPRYFGITEAGDSMWVIKSCFGTFLLCLEVGSPSETTTDSISSPSSTLLWSTKDNAREEDLQLVHTRASQHGDVTQDHVTDDHVTDLVTEAVLTTLTANTTTKPVSRVEIIVNENESFDLSTKVLLIAAITTAGLFLTCLIVTVGWFTVLRKDRPGRTQRPINEIDPEETTVTSLPVSDCHDIEGIYNEIPFDDIGFVSENNHVKSITEVRHYEHNDLHIYATVRRQHCDTGNTSSLSTYDENEYDRLRNTPKVSVSDSSTYNRLSDVVRDERSTDECCVNNQNESPPS